MRQNRLRTKNTTPTSKKFSEFLLLSADNVPRLPLNKGMAHRNSPQTYFMCGSKNRRVHARVCVCVDGVGSPNSENFFEVGVVFLVLNLLCRMGHRVDAVILLSVFSSKYLPTRVWLNQTYGLGGNVVLRIS